MLVDLLINIGRSLTEGALNERALVEPGSEEDGIETKQDPCAFAEGQSGEEKTSPKQDLKGCNKCHAAVVVFLDEFANGGTQATLRLWCLW